MFVCIIGIRLFISLFDFTGMLKMLFMGVMDMTTMATVCVWSSLEVEEEVEVVVVLEEGEEEGGEWDPQGEGMVPHPDARRTGWLSQVSGVFFYLKVVVSSLKVCSCMCKAYKTFVVIYLLGLPPSGSWQDLKDHMREAGDVCYADVFRDGTGVVEFVRKEDMTYAVRKLDNTKFRSHEVCKSSHCQTLLIRTNLKSLVLRRRKKGDNWTSLGLQRGFTFNQTENK